MKNIQSAIRIFVVTAVLFSTSTYPQNTGEWLWKNKKPIGGAALVVGTVVSLNFGIPALIKQYHSRELSRSRANITKKTEINSQVSDAIKTTLENNKKELESKWKLHHQIGISVSGSTSLPSRCNVANAFCLNLTVASDGILSNCIATNSTTIDGNIIANTCQFKGHVTIDEPASFASFTNCLIGNIKTNNTIIELCSSVVEGNIAFNKPGIVVVDNQTVISGTVINGTVMRY